MDSKLKKDVKDYYGNIASSVLNSNKSSSCCCSSCCGDMNNGFSLYTQENIKDLPKEAIDASLGCAAPILFADITKNEVVLDLGSGGGIDVFQASKLVGEDGKVYGLDMTDEMLNLANKNKEAAGIENVEFIKGYIENIPLPEEAVDVIISNCVINLSEDKEKSLAEAYRVLKKGGRLAVADIITMKAIPNYIRNSAEMWAGCIAGTIGIEEYKSILGKVGFKNIEITPVHTYTRDLIHSISQKENKKLLELYDENELSLLDGAFASASIKAVK